MRREKRFAAWVLALVLTFCLTVQANAAGTAAEITAYINYGVAVTYNGEVQTLEDTGGNTVYPISYNGAAYLPIRAAGNMLGVEVDWDGSARSVLLRKSTGGQSADSTGEAPPSAGGVEAVRAYLDPGITVQYDGEVQTLEDASGNALYPISYNGAVYLPVRALSELLGIKVDWDGTAKTVILINPKTDVFKGLMTSENAEVLGAEHIGNGWAEIDWSTAGDSYIRVRINELPDGPSTRASCRVRWNDGGRCRYSDPYTMSEGEWNIPLTGGGTEYAVQIDLTFLACEHYLTEEEKEAYDGPSNPLTARFRAGITDPDNVWLLSAPNVDFTHAPLTCATALEITKDCETDAEKITAVFRYVAETLQYDHPMADEITGTGRGESSVSCLADPVNGRHRLPPDSEEYGYTTQSALNLDTVLTRASGVCAQYATLMTGMLRSLGVPCKVAAGVMRAPDGRSGPHAWVVVNPQTGELDWAALGAGRDLSSPYGSGTPTDTGWIRLDPTNGLRNPAVTSDDGNYDVHLYY